MFLPLLLLNVVNTIFFSFVRDFASKNFRVKKYFLILKSVSNYNEGFWYSGERRLQRRFVKLLKKTPEMLEKFWFENQQKNEAFECARILTNESLVLAKNAKKYKWKLFWFNLVKQKCKEFHNSMLVLSLSRNVLNNNISLVESENFLSVTNFERKSWVVNLLPANSKKSVSELQGFSVSTYKVRKFSYKSNRFVFFSNVFSILFDFNKVNMWFSFMRCFKEILSFKGFLFQSKKFDILNSKLFLHSKRYLSKRKSLRFVWLKEFNNVSKCYEVYKFTKDFLKLQYSVAYFLNLLDLQFKYANISVDFSNKGIFNFIIKLDSLFGISKSIISDILVNLKDGMFKAKTLIDLVCIDNFTLDRSSLFLDGVEERFILLYVLRSYIYNTTFMLYVPIPKKDVCKVMSCSNIYNSANWSEREVWDMFGIKFVGHLDLRRILSDYGFRGFPLRKDFPSIGFKQVKYDNTETSVVYENTFLSQEERDMSVINRFQRLGNLQFEGVIKKRFDTFFPEIISGSLSDLKLESVEFLQRLMYCTNWDKINSKFF